jgi:D-beta-D-heptose 7-phosphate kinase/D-beta-D-heptose 1-phosphate adenosyltransferase
MLKSLPDFDAVTLLVAGDVMLDRYWNGATERISPEAPVPVVRVTGDESRPGGASNVALNAAALGARVVLAGLAGADADADLLDARLRQAGIDSRLARLAGEHTIVKLRVVSKHQQLLRLDFEGAPLADPQGLLQAACDEAVGRCQGVALSDYAKGALARAEHLIGLARQRGLPVVVDPKGRDFARYRGATVLTPNQSEFEAVVGALHDDADFIAKADALRADLDLGALLVTRGEKGMALFQSGQAPYFLPTQAREVYDVTGAGDTVAATLAAGLAAGMAMPDAVYLANVAAGIVVGKFGTATTSREELALALAAHTPMRHGVVAEDELAALVARARAAGERIVMTNGCFDILHAGHVAYLRQASELGDRLIVAVNDDASVTRLKGAGRPINPVEARMAVLAGLSAVDWVVPFAEDTPERLICRLLPDVLVKGGDYRAEDVAGGACVQGAGGEVRILQFVDGYSTSRVIDRIRTED